MSTHDPGTAGSAEGTPRADALPFPYPGREVRSRSFPVTSVAHDVIEQLGAEDLYTLLRISVWYSRGEAYDARRVADELWSGNPRHALNAVESLAEQGHVFRPGVQA